MSERWFQLLVGLFDLGTGFFVGWLAHTLYANVKAFKESMTKDSRP